jgi:DNA helicase-2/ATP-dependent DNA helicase PcrA
MANDLAPAAPAPPLEVPRLEPPALALPDPAPPGLGLNPQQLQAAAHRGAPLLIVAGAGTGKTATVVARVASLIGDGILPERILLLTFTRRAAAEMVSRVAATSGAPARGIWGGTFHSVANRLLRHYGSAAGLPEGFTVLDHGDSVETIALIRADEGFAQRGRRFPRAETIANVYSRMVNAQTPLERVLEVDFPWCVDHLDDLRTVFEVYTATKRRNRVLDYDDLLLFWRGLTASPVGEALRCLFDHILVDEYQDTNALQAEIVRAMAGHDTEVCAVGDDAQAIYGFRAATPTNLWEFPTAHPGAATVVLEQNYRSTMPILAVANAVLDQERPSPVASGVGHRRRLWSSMTSGPRPTLLCCEDEIQQSRLVADRILEARERGIELRDQAVLFRAGHHADGLELELARRDVPYVKYGGLRYLDTAHVRDLLALLRILENPDDELAWFRVLRGLDGVGPATVRRLIDELRVTKPNSDALARLIDGIGRFPRQAADQADELRSALADCAAGHLDPGAEVDRLGRFCRLVFPSRYENGLARLADVDRLATAARGYTSRSRFLTELTLDPPSRVGEAVPPTRDDEWLTLSTIHSAKGCEWRAVHLLNAADGNIPSEMALGDDRGLAEELRLLYVAVTRARAELTVSFPHRFHVNRFAADDRHVYARLSRFLDPMRHLFDETVERHDDKEARAVPLTPVGVAEEVDAMLASLLGGADPETGRPTP